MYNGHTHEININIFVLNNRTVVMNVAFVTDIIGIDLNYLDRLFVHMIDKAVVTLSGKKYPFSKNHS